MTESIARVPWYPLVFPLFYGAVAVFGVLVARHLRVFAAVRPARPFADVPRRTAALLRYAILQTRMFREVRVGVMHYLIFAAFVTLGIGVASAVTGGLVEAVLAAPARRRDLGGGPLPAQRGGGPGRRRPGLRAGAAARRPAGAPHPGPLGDRDPPPDRRRSSVPSWARSATRRRATARCPGRSSRTRSAPRCAGVDPGRSWRRSSPLHWWAHLALVAAFLAWLPTTKHLHVVTSFFNVYLRKLEPRGALPAMDLEAEDATYGLRTLGDLAWKDVLDGFTCTECGRCQDACPANFTGKPLDPKALVMGIRHLADEAERGLHSSRTRRRAGTRRRRRRPARGVRSRSCPARSPRRRSGTA